MSEPERLQLRIPVDGAALAGDVLLPPGGLPAPALVSLYPYHKDDVIGSLFEGPRRRFVDAGFASVLVDMRGHGASSGAPGVSFDLAGIEGADAAATVEWVAEQGWCDGGVGAWGVSYGGMTALAAAVRRPPHLRAIASVYAAGDPARDLIAPGGSPMAFGRYLWAAHMLAMDLCPPSSPDPEGAWMDVWQERLARLRSSPGYAFDWQGHEPSAEWWARRALDLGRIEVPTMVVGGWYDFFVEGTVRAFAEVAGERTMVIGPWLHVLPDLAEHEPWDWVGELVTFFTRHLAGGAAGRAAVTPQPPSSALVFVRSKGWRRYPQWPPSEISWQHWHLGPKRRLAPHPVTSAEEPVFELTEVTGRSSGLFDPLGTGFGYPEDQHLDDVDSLCFESEPLMSDVEIAGRARLGLPFLGHLGSELRLCVKLSAVDVSGRAELLSSGWLDVPVAEDSSCVVIETTPAAAVVAAGRRLRLALSCADFPRFWPSPPGAGFVIGVGGDHAAVLCLPCAPAGGDETEVSETAPVRPPAGVSAELGWTREATARWRRSLEQPLGRRRSELELFSHLEPPSGSSLRFAERFGAEVGEHDPSTARVDGEVTIVLEHATGWRAEVDVGASFTEHRAEARGRVLVNGEVVFEETWANPPVAGR